MVRVMRVRMMRMGVVFTSVAESLAESLLGLDLGMIKMATCLLNMVDGFAEVVESEI